MSRARGVPAGIAARVVAVAVLLSCVSWSAAAQDRDSSRSRAFGPSIGLALHGMQYTLAGFGAETGGGASFTLGYGFNSHVGAFVQWSADKYQSEGREASTLKAFDLGVRYRLRDSRGRFRPFVDAGIGKRSHHETLGVLCGCLARMRGTELLAGVGLEQFFARRASFTAQLQLASTTYDDQRFGSIGGFTPSDASGRTVRVSIGTTFYVRRLSEAERADDMARDSAKQAPAVVEAPAPAALGRQRGVFLQAGLEPTVLSSDDGGGNAAGGGGAVRVGYRIVSGIALFGEFARGVVFEGSNHAILDHLQAGLRLNAASRRRVVPYLELAAGRRTLTNNDGQICDPTCLEFDTAEKGGIFSFGGGLVLGAQSRVATDLGLRWSVGEFDDFTLNGLRVPGVPPEAATSTRVHLGFTFR